MAETSRGRGAFKFVFWTVLAVGLGWLSLHWNSTGQWAEWYYYSASANGYAVDANHFMSATKENPAVLEIGSFQRLTGFQTVRVKKGERLPANTNGVISDEVLKEGKRAVLEGDRLKVMVPWKIEESKGFKFKDTFKHKGVKTYPWAAVVNVLMIGAVGLSLGFMAEGLTDVMGIKFEKIRHFEGH